MNFNIITSFISLLWVLLVGTSNEGTRLNKQVTKEDDKILFINWFYMNKDFIALAAILISLTIFIYACFAFVGVSATESGMMRNFIGGEL